MVLFEISAAIAANFSPVISPIYKQQTSYSYLVSTTTSAIILPLSMIIEFNIYFDPDLDAAGAKEGSDHGKQSVCYCDTMKYFSTPTTHASNILID